MLNFNTLPDDRAVDRCPAQNRSTALDMLGGDVSAAIEVGVQLEPARTTPKDRLRHPATLVLHATPRARLAGVAWIDPNHLAACRFGFVGQESAQLGERPGVQTAALLGAALLRSGPYVGQVLHDDGGTSPDRLHDPFAENVVAITPKPCRLAAQTPQSTFGSDGAFGLKLTTQTEGALFDGPPVARPEKGVVGHHRRLRPRSTPTTAPESSNGTSGSVTTACNQSLPLRRIRSAVSKPIAWLSTLCACGLAANATSCRPATLARLAPSASMR